MEVVVTKKSKSFEGETIYYEHKSSVTKTSMKFSTFIPSTKKIKSAIIWLSGLTCNEENFITKSGIQNCLKNSSTMIICPDTSPRGLNLPGEHDSYDFGSGAGFYVNALTEGYKVHYQMYDYISQEVVSILRDFFNIEKISIMGHSMGGHGALILGLREKNLFSSVSAFSPIVNPSRAPWGQKAFKGYLGSDFEVAKTYDATELLKSGIKRSDSILIDQGTDDEYLKENLLTDNFAKACKNANQELILNYREGYDHSYFFISTFLESHIQFHLSKL
jgi:S-formylglutathione hydrolase